MKKVECPYCEGLGEIYDGRKVTSRSIDPPMTTCPECGGKRWVYENEAELIDCDKSISEIEEEYKASAWEARWELENDR